MPIGRLSFDLLDDLPKHIAKSAPERMDCPRPKLNSHFSLGLHLWHEGIINRSPGAALDEGDVNAGYKKLTLFQELFHEQINDGWRNTEAVTGIVSVNRELAREICTARISGISA